MLPARTMTKISTKPPSGMRDFLPQDVARRRYVTRIVQEVYEAHGFVPLETPTIENLSTLLGKYGEEGDQLLYRVLHRRDALRRPLDKAHAEGRVAKAWPKVKVKGHADEVLAAAQALAAG